MDAQPINDTVPDRGPASPAPPVKTATSTADASNAPGEPSANAAHDRSRQSLLHRLLLPIYVMPSGRKLFLIILFALAPLALITLIANVQSARAGDAERRQLLSGANQDIARRIAATIVTDEELVRRPLAAFNAASATQSEPAPANPAPDDAAAPAAPVADEIHYEDLCASIARALLTSKDAAPELHLLRASDGSHLCHSSISENDAVLSKMALGDGQLTIGPDESSIIDVIPIDSNGTRLVAMLIYSRSLLQGMADPINTLPPYNLYLAKDDRQINLSEQLGAWAPNISVTTPVGRTGANLEISAHRKSLSQNDIVSFLAPIGMWLLAGGLAWVLVNLLLLKPLKEIQRSVAFYRPGQLYRPHPRGAGIASEITELEQDMADLSQMVARDKRALAAGLEKQTLLTREVHHRVKNNLQIIASLLNIHSRSATAPAAAEAYRSIQRRVDALSAVHRNHFAELEDNEGIALRPLLSELAASLRGGSLADGGMAVTVDADAVQIEQDTAVPVGFLVTEIGELALLAGNGAAMKISVRHDADEEMAQLSIQSDNLKDSEKLATLLETRFGRVLTGLSRQLRQPLIYDEDEGSYQIRFTTLD